MEPNLQTGKLIIPARQYKPYPYIESTPLAKTQLILDNIQKEEVKLNFFPKEKSSSSHPSTDFSIPQASLTLSSYSSTASKVKETFEKLRKSVNEKVSLKLVRLSQKFLAKTESIKAQGASEIAELNQHESFLLSQLGSCTESEKSEYLSEVPSKNANSLIPDISKSIEKISEVSIVETFNPVPDIPIPKEKILEITKNEQTSKKNQTLMNDLIQKPNEGFLISYYGGSMKICKDFQKIESFKNPVTITNGFNFLVLNPIEVLIANDQNSNVHIWNICTNKTTQLANFSEKRSFFGIGFIGKNPAIIGGIAKKSKRPTGCVEVLHNYNKWVQEKSLVHPRSHCHSIQHKDITFVFGGFSGGYVRSIEKYDNQWSVINVILPIMANKFALCCKGDEIYIFGGKNSDMKLNSVYAFHTVSLVFRTGKNLPNCIEESYGGGVVYKDGIFCLLDSMKGKIIKYNG